MSSMMLKRLSAKTYLLLLSLFGLLLVGLFGLHLVMRADQIKNAMEQERHQAASDELQRSVENVLEQVHNILADLVAWDEVHQQLGDPTYYVYWRELRLKETSRLPVYVSALELYDADGQSLVRLPYESFPAKLPARPVYLTHIDGREYLMAYVPIRERGGKGEENKGYLGLQVDFLQALRHLNRFVVVDAASLHIPATLEHPVAVEQIPAVIEYAQVSESFSNRLGDMLLASLGDFFLLLATLLLAFYVTVAYLFVRPLKVLERHIARLRQGGRGDDGGLNMSFPMVAELLTVRDSLDEYQRELDSARMRLDQQNVELWKLAHTDALTGVGNRLAFEEDWKDLIKLAGDRRIDISMMLLDCDFFKAINDTYGHEVGDRVIHSIADSLQKVLRDGEKLYRLGGDEFVTVLVNAGRDVAQKVAERCVEAVQQNTFRHLGIKEKVKLSVGLSHASGLDIANLSELPRQADVAMYHAKSSTREKIVHYSASLEESASSLVSNRIVGAVLRALESGEGVQMHYQPLVGATDQQPAYYEALIRISDENGQIVPADIFPVIARRRLELELDKTVLEAVERDLERRLLPNGVGISVNVSGALLGLNEFCDYFSSLARFLDRHPIIIEITETSFISHLQHASEALQRLRKRGFLVALDDFGSGYSSIRYLANMPVDLVKFDISMVHDLNKDKRTRIIIEHTAALINEAGYSLVAEGIEDAKTLARVAALNPAYYQGYLFGRPQSLETLFGA